MSAWLRAPCVTSVDLSILIYNVGPLIASHEVVANIKATCVKPTAFGCIPWVFPYVYLSFSFYFALIYFRVDALHSLFIFMQTP